MTDFFIQLIDSRLPSDWWREVMERFLEVGDPVELRLWPEESAELRLAAALGPVTAEGWERVARGTLTRELRTALLAAPPADGSGYSKMTRFFTIHAKNSRCDLWSQHYGTELAVSLRDPEDAAFLRQVLARYPEGFSVSEGEGLFPPGQ